MSIVALIAARNEPEIGLAVDSIHHQLGYEVPVIVVANNCTDDGETVRLAETHGAQVYDLGVVTGKKAGALNAGLDIVLKKYPDTEFLLQMDAETALEEHFLERTVAAMRANPRIAGLCACFLGRPKKGSNLWNKFLISCQRQEYARYNGNQLALEVSVLSGTASLLRVEALLDLKHDRGYIWDETCISEDFETTKALQLRGWLCMSDKTFVSYTDVMTSWHDLLQQRKRWQRGTLDVVFRLYRGERCVRREVWQQRIAYLAYPLQLLSYLFVTVSSIVWHVSLLPLLTIIAVFGLYGAYSVRRAGWRSMMLAVLFFPGELYSALRYYWLVRSYRLYRNQASQSW